MITDMSATGNTLLWLRRDLRLHDHAALHRALTYAGPVQPVFVFDTAILARFANPDDRRLSFLAETLCNLHHELSKRGGGLLVLHGDARTVIPALGATRIVASADFEPQTRARDKAVTGLERVKDHLIFAPHEVLKADGTPFKVYTPYARAWRERLQPADIGEYAIRDKGRYADYTAARAYAEKQGLRVLSPESGPEIMLAAIGYTYRKDPLWPPADGQKRLRNFTAHVARYPATRDIPADETGTSRLSPYLRFGLISIRETWRVASETPDAEKWLSELIWREFYAMILYHWPHSATEEWNPAYRGLPWRNDPAYLAAWKEGRTGYPIVDAAMRELKQTGWMHNRARMIVASFFTKHLQMDWRLGEEHFAQYLMDYEMASNVGGWQWAASTGTDAQPYFRVFNPTLQSRKFDPQGAYIRRYVPELARLSDKDIHAPGTHYISPIVDHAAARAAAIAMFKSTSRIASS